jgi:hypothetical protein
MLAPFKCRVHLFFLEVYLLLHVLSLSLICVFFRPSCFVKWVFPFLSFFVFMCVCACACLFSLLQWVSRMNWVLGLWLELLQKKWWFWDFRSFGDCGVNVAISRICCWWNSQSKWFYVWEISLREEGFLFHPSFIHFLGFLNKIRMRVILHHQTAFATFVQINVPYSYPCAAAIPTIENAWENTN